ncbi:amino acid ABC transporter permease [Acuticoccus kandeliae]|uniref:amino acid ABC transporter permease n=1 Tax=Acuticoccus kandeliae TaxID=2073160 RepID=UPI000D3EE217|nr:amino acid ABC transporter permease [Acuticoccus kandeliae]
MVRTFGLDDFILLLIGLQWTLAIAAVAFVGGIIGGLVVALCRVSPKRLVRLPAQYLIEVFQGTPLLMQLFLVYFGIGILGINVSPWTAICVAYTCHASAFLGEIWRGCIQAVPRGQSEAAFALSLSYASRMRYVVLPQALRISLPATIGFLVQLIKGTSLASIVGFTELMRSGQYINNATYQPMIVYGVVGLMYFAVCWPLSFWSMRLEHRLAASTR